MIVFLLKVLRFFWSLPVCLLGLAGCSQPPIVTPPPTPIPLTVALTPAARPFGKILRVCAASQPLLAFFLEEAPAQGMDLNRYDLVFRLGLPAESEAFSAPLGWENIVVYTNEPAVTQLKKSDLRGLFSGKITIWKGADGLDHPVQVWTFPAGDEARQVFDEAIMAGERLTPKAYLAPDPQAMLEALSSQAGSVGILPAAWVKSSKPAGSFPIHEVSLDAGAKSVLRLPILALAKAEPQGAARSLISCLQSKDGQAMISSLYETWDNK